MNFWQSLAGMLQISVTSANMVQTLDGLNQLGIPIYDLVEVDALTVTFRISRPVYKTVAACCEKQGNSIKIIGRHGLFWTGKAFTKRPVLLSGLLLLLLLAALLPTRVYFFDIEGNTTIPDNRILEAAEGCGIRFGVSRKSIRSEKMKNALLSALPQLQWAGINTYGCRGVISVREREEPPQPEGTPEIFPIVAVRDGIVTSCTVTRGSGVCTVGQPVQQDQLLISPYVDCGLSIKVVAPEGEVYAETNRRLRCITPANHTAVRDTGEQRRRFSLILGKKRINFWKGSGISDTTCGRMYAEYYITLPGGFRLPVCLAVETLTSRTGSAAERTQEDATSLLSTFATEYLTAQMIAGSILEKRVRIIRQGECWCLEADFVCNEMISRIGAERNGEWNG